MTHQIDREAVLERLRALDFAGHYGEAWFQDIADDIIDLVAPMEAVAWREKVKGPAAWLNRWAAHVGGCRGGQACACGLTMAQFEIEQALALIATSEPGS